MRARAIRSRVWARGPLCLMLLGLTLVGVAIPTFAEDRVTARAFEIHYRSLSDAADLVGGLLSVDGSVTLKPRLATLVVEDRESVLAKVQDLIKSYDVPPQRVEATLSLFLGRRKPEEKGGAPSSTESFSEEVRGIIESLRDVTQWNEYQSLGSSSIEGLEGQPVTADLAPNYRLQFKIGKVDDVRGVVKFERFALQRLSAQGASGARGTVEDLYTAAMVVEAGKLTMIVAARAPDSEEAIFLALKVDPR